VSIHFRHLHHTSNTVLLPGQSVSRETPISLQVTVGEMDNSGYCAFINFPPELIFAICSFIERKRDISAFIIALSVDKRITCTENIRTENVMYSRRFDLLELAQRVLLANKDVLAIAGSAAIPGFRFFKDVDMFVINGGTPNLSILKDMGCSRVDKSPEDQCYPSNLIVATFSVPFMGDIQIIKYVDTDDEAWHALVSVLQQDRVWANLRRKGLHGGALAEILDKVTPVKKTLQEILDDFDMPFSSIGYTTSGELVYGAHYGTNEYNCKVVKDADEESKAWAVRVAFSRAFKYIYKYKFMLDIRPLVSFAKDYELPVPKWAIKAMKKKRT
jgi:hypothetical protein